MQLLVIGMHRTGTSALTGVLNLCGAYVGHEGSMTRPNRNNPRGFWERRDVRRLNDLLLHDIGCDWDRVSAVGARQPNATTLAEFDTGADAVVRELDEHRPWVMKEPRLCVTLPWWRPHLDAPVCVFTHRNPLEIARSLTDRNGFPLPFGLALWERYMQLALEATSGMPRVWIGHDELLRHPVDVIASLIQTLEKLGVKGLALPNGSAITDFIDPALQRQRATDVEVESALTPEQLTLHASLKHGNGLAAGFVHRPNPVSKDVLRVFEVGLEWRDSIRAKYRQRKAEWRSERALLEAAVQHAVRDVERLQAALTAAQSGAPADPSLARADRSSQPAGMSSDSDPTCV